MTRRRRLRPEEMDLWRQVARSADPLHPHSDRPDPETLIPSKPKAHPRPDPDPIPTFDIGSAARGQTRGFEPPRTTSERLKGDGVRMDAKAFKHLKRGRLVPEARLDLHGMTLDRAHGALTRFILSSQAQGLRLVLVITGKGTREDPYDPAPRRRGVLKSQVPHWLRMHPVSEAVLQVSEAHQKHGGTGAYYVYLRRRR